MVLLLEIKKQKYEKKFKALTITFTDFDLKCNSKS